jgi:hypothetical protein
MLIVVHLVSEFINFGVDTNGALSYQGTGTVDSSQNPSIADHQPYTNPASGYYGSFLGAQEQPGMLPTGHYPLTTSGPPTAYHYASTPHDPATVNPSDNSWPIPPFTGHQPLPTYADTPGYYGTQQQSPMHHNHSLTTYNGSAPYAPATVDPSQNLSASHSPAAYPPPLNYDYGGQQYPEQQSTYRPLRPRPER